MRRGVLRIDSEYIENTNTVAKAIKVAIVTFIGGKLRDYRLEV